MPKFIVNREAQSTGEHEVHNIDAGCNHLPSLQNQRALGTFPSCHGAITEARKHYNNVDGCYYCSPACHSK